MKPTTIEWVARPNADGTLRYGYTYNPWIGCVKVSPACDHCYAAAMKVRRCPPGQQICVFATTQPSRCRKVRLHPIPVAPLATLTRDGVARSGASVSS